MKTYLSGNLFEAVIIFDYICYKGAEMTATLNKLLWVNSHKNDNFVILTVCFTHTYVHILNPCFKLFCGF